ncbi:sporulation protein YqfD [Alkalihalobacillus trypoxylicola]|uniref:Stage IV sporulation protein n=1 Tax=Alkalihalobacillus trypoxylicola TaxID=519424 RepID=A0A161PGW8_9BACI|nr:sporulation protein YqfD [Alkalihalobacillus trypoxylicola]KYG32034.1 stage IV sporulation protein [Alkalihalobacillus trypoxylicola]
MKNSFIKKWNGYVRVTIDAPFPEHFVNRCLEEGIEIWKLKKIADKRLSFYMNLEDIREIKPILRQSEAKIRFSSRHGMPFLLKAMMTRAGFSVGLLLCISMLLLGTNMVWGIEIKGASPHVEVQLKKLVNEIGIKKGKFQFQLPTEEQIQTIVTEQLEGATWVGVRKKGTTYEFEVVEQTLPERAELLSPRNLVSNKTAIIHDIFVKHGQALVEPNDFVKKGEVLITGLIGKDDKKEVVAAEGVVRGEIWYESTVEIELTSMFTNLTGEKKEKSYVKFGDFAVPIWGFGQHQFDESQSFEEEHPFKLFKWESPISYKKETIYETNPFERTYTEEEAIEKGMERAKEDMLKRIPVNAEIIAEKVLHESIENGKVKLQIHYKVIEDIMIEQPIIQGD